MKNIDRVIDNISYDKIVNLLVSLGWSQYHSLMNGTVLQYVSPDKNCAVLIPVTDTFDDYYTVMESTLRKIAAFLKVSVETLVNRLFGVSYDIIKWRVANDNTHMGMIPMYEMLDTISGIKQMLAVSYNDIQSPDLFYKKVFTKEVNENLSKYSIGQTEVGSYILNIMCPLSGFQFEMFDTSAENLPLNRKINMHIMRSINKIQSDIKAGNRGRFDEDVAAGGYSINFLDSLTDIYNSHIDSIVDISMDWCNAIQIEANDFPSELELTPRIVEDVVYVADKYRPKAENNVEKTFYGKIEQISADGELARRDFVDIKMITLDDEGRKAIVLAKLDYHRFYKVISTAFQNGLTVRLSGKLQNIGRSRSIENGVLSIAE